MPKKSPTEINKTFLIVGMGASAGGLEAFKEFFQSMPKNPGMAFILVQHLDPTHKSLMVPLLRGHTDMKVMEVKNRTVVKPDTIYVIPPNKDMGILNGVLHLMQPTAARGFRRPIDFFLRSLAEDQRENAVGIILSGTGSEGTLSLKAIKGQGGLALVQDPETAKYDGMPRSAIAAGAEDFVLPLDKMSKLLLNYAKKRTGRLIEKPMVKESPNDLMEKIFILLRNETGCNFSDYKINTVVRRIEKRMALNQIDSLETYIKYLQSNKKEVHKLFSELLIGVTGFFRDTEAFKALEKIIIPELINKKKDGETIRVWVPGCSTGEEAYSLVILFNDLISVSKKSLHVQLFASDLDENAIAFARQGTYPDTISTAVSAARLKKYFIPGTHTYTIKKEIRDQVIFSVHNLSKDPPFSKLDLLSCRNLLIYLNIEAQKKVFAIFHYALNPDGILFLGSSESLGEYASLFEVLDRKQKIYRHKKTSSSKIPDIGYLFKEPAIVRNNIAALPKREQIYNLADITKRLLLIHYAPAGAVINSKGDAVYFSGNTGKYLQPSPGEARLHIVDMARNGLKPELRALISKVRKTKKQEVRKGVQIKSNGSVIAVDISLRPIKNFDLEDEFLLLTFEDRDTEVVVPSEEKIETTEQLTELNALEQELAATKEYLRSTIEQLEISNEELKSSNEELQSSNEELQSTNEEMETSKEELQSVNEEIVTVNSELQDKIEELAQAYDDMNNLLASTEIGTLFIDSNLTIKRFTPSIKKIINVIDLDVGRPLKDISSNLIYSDLFDDIQSVLETLVPIKKVVKSADGLFYQMQLMPYRSSENVINGAVITFVNITQEVALAEELKKHEKEYEQLLELTKTFVYTQDKELKYTSVANTHSNMNFKGFIGKTDEELFGKDNAQKLFSIKNKVLTTRKPERATIALQMGSKTQFYDVTVRPVLEDNNLLGIACTSTDITELKEVEKEIIQLKKNRDDDS